MLEKRYVPYSVMVTYLREHPGYHATSDAFARAAQYFMANGLAREEIAAFPNDCDVVMLSDEEFLRRCDDLPVDITAENSTFLLADGMFPHNYDCFLLRHLNDLPPEDHSHDFFEIDYVWSGACVHHTAGQTIAMAPGDFLILPPDLSHHIRAEEGAVIFNILVRPSAFRNVLAPLLVRDNVISAFFRRCLVDQDRSLCLLLHTPNDHILRRIIKHLAHQCYTRQSIYCDFAISVFSQLFAYFLTAAEVDGAYLGLSDNFTIMRVMLDIQQNFRTVTLRSLAAQYFFTEEHLSRLIKKTTGKTFSILLRDTRVEQAKLFLSRTHYNLDTVGELVGYGDAASFSRVFKRATGYSPAQYRKQFPE